MKKYYADIQATLFFGILSIIFGFALFRIPEVKGVFSDLREIPLLISLSFIKHPFFIFPLSLITSISVAYQDGSYFSSTFMMHFGGLLFAWYCYQLLIHNKPLNFKTGFTWFLIVQTYYWLIVIPVLIFVNIHFEGEPISFFDTYQAIIPSTLLEVTSTTLITLFYLYQRQTQKLLIQVNQTLGDKIKERTIELEKANEKLRLSNEEISVINENLESIVIERTTRLNVQLQKMSEYAHANAHEVRGPMARILGLLQLLEFEANPEKKAEILSMINQSARELDLVIRKMNALLDFDKQKF